MASLVINSKFVDRKGISRFLYGDDDKPKVNEAYVYLNGASENLVRYGDRPDNTSLIGTRVCLSLELKSDSYQMALPLLPAWGTVTAELEVSYCLRQDPHFLKGYARIGFDPGAGAISEFQKDMSVLNIERLLDLDDSRVRLQDELQASLAESMPSIAFQNVHLRFSYDSRATERMEVERKALELLSLASQLHVSAKVKSEILTASKLSELEIIQKQLVGAQREQEQAEVERATCKDLLKELEKKGYAVLGMERDQIESVKDFVRLRQMKEELQVKLEVYLLSSVKDPDLQPLVQIALAAPTAANLKALRDGIEELASQVMSDLKARDLRRFMEPLPIPDYLKESAFVIAKSYYLSNGENVLKATQEVMEALSGVSAKDGGLVQGMLAIRNMVGTGREGQTASALPHPMDAGQDIAVLPAPKTPDDSQPSSDATP